MKRSHSTADALAVARRVVAVFRAEEVTFLAAAVAYYAFLSLVPSLMLLFAVASTLGGETLATEVLDATGDALSPVGRDLVRDVLAGGGGRAPATVVSLSLLAWSALKVFRGLDVAFSRIYDTEPSRSFLDGIRDAVVALAGVGLALAAVVALSVGASRFDVGSAFLLGTVGLLAVLTVVFFPVFYLLPDYPQSPLSVLPGTVAAAVGWSLLGTGFRIYAGMAGQFDVYGVLGVVLLLVTWYYVGSVIVLIGAAINAVLGGRHAKLSGARTCR